MNAVLLQTARIAAVIGLVVWAAVLATPPGRLPLAVRGLAKLLRRDAGGEAAAEERQASASRRFAAFMLVLLAALVAIL